MVEKILQPRTGAAFVLRSGERFRLEDVAGQQVSDLVAFCLPDYTERFSQANSRKLNGTLLLSTGNLLYSTKCRPILEIVADTVGRHDLQSSACSPYDYPIRFGVTDHPSCLAILRDELAPLGIEEHLIPDPLNVFMATSVDQESGRISVLSPLSRAGDHIEFEAKTHALVALTVCPQDMNDCNGGAITPLKLLTPDDAAEFSTFVRS